MGERSRQWGWRRAVYWHVMTFLSKRLGFRIHYANVGADRPYLLSIYRDPPEIPQGYSVRFGCREDFQRVAGVMPGIDDAFVAEAFDRGDECSVVYCGDELVNYCFWTRAWAPVTDQLRILVPGGFRYVYKAWTHPDHRRRNLSNVNTYFRNMHRVAPFEERSVSYVETHNYPSLGINYRHPTERGIRVGFVGWFTVFGRQIPFSTRQARWVGLVFSRNPSE